MPPSSMTDLAVALCICAVAVPGCNRNRAAGQRAMATNEPAADRGPGAPVAAAGMISRVSVALHTGTDAKDSAESVTVRLFRGNDPVAEQTLGAGEAWGPGAFRAVELPLEPALPASAAREMRLEVSKADPAGGPGRPWGVQVEALGQLSDGRVIRLLEPTSGVQIGGDNPFRRAWILSPG
ncbi:MAG: hypothetical protein WD749_03820 [Phycisphaerales bacterium]